LRKGDNMNSVFEFPERLWKRPIEFHQGKPHVRVAASSYDQEMPRRMLRDESVPVGPQNDSELNQPENSLADEPRVKVSTEAGNARVIVQLPSARKRDLRLHCAEEFVTLSVRTAAGPWVKEIQLPFRVDPDTAKASFRNGKLELIVRRHGRFNPARPRLDWV